jgi:hypothetical protein
MTNTQLFLAIGIPSVLILLGMFLNSKRFDVIESKLTVIEADLRRFYHELGEHNADIITLKERK